MMCFFQPVLDLSDFLQTIFAQHFLIKKHVTLIETFSLASKINTFSFAFEFRTLVSTQLFIKKIRFRSKGHLMLSHNVFLFRFLDFTRS